MNVLFRLCTLLPLASITSAHAAQPPNILFILADDLGHTDVNAYAEKATGESKDKMFYETLNIDRLAAGSIAFSQAYAYQLPAGNWSDVPVAASDLFPTLVQAGGIEPETLRAKHKIDGHSLVSLCKEPTNKKMGYVRDSFIWHYPFNVAPLHPDDGFPLTPHSAIRKGDFKLIFDWNGRLWLHDIKNDPFEKQNLAESMPEKTRELFKELNDWLDANVATKYMPALNPDYDFLS